MKKKVNMKIAIPVMVAVLALAVILKCFGLLTFRSGMRYGFVGNDGIHKYNGSYSKNLRRVAGTSTGSGRIDYQVCAVFS